MPDLLARTAVEVAQLLSPLRLAVEDTEELALFLRRFGLPLRGSQLTALVTSLGPLRTGVVSLLGAADDALDGGVSGSELQALLVSARPLFDTVQSMGAQLSSLAAAVPTGAGVQPFTQVIAGFPEELLDLLLADYLSGRVPVLLHLLSVLDVVRVEAIPASGHALSRGLEYVRHHFDWERVSLLFDRPDVWAREAYGWGVNFDSDKFIGRLGRIFELFGGMASSDEMTEAELQAFLPDWPAPMHPPLQLLAPVIRKQVSHADGRIDASASGEAGIAFFPISGKTASTRTTDKGLGIGPYLDGSAGASVDLGGGLSARAHGSLGAVGGVVFALRPSGVEIKTGLGAAAVSGAVALEATLAPAGGLLFLGSAGGTRVEAKSVSASLGGEVSTAGSDFYLAAGIKELKAVIDPGDDGLLSAILSQPIEIKAGDIGLGYRHGRGLYFDSGSNLALTVPLNLALGPLNISELGLVLDWSEPPSLTVAVTGDLTIGPLFAYAENIGLKTTIVPDPDGMLGNHDLRFAFKPPDAYAISLDAAPIEGGGMLAVYEHEYRGALALQFESIGFSAFAILTTRLPNGQAGFSFAGSIFGEFSLPLGYGFFLTGLGGVIGINRRVNTDALREVLFAGRFDNLLFPQDPIANAATILQDMAAILPVQSGQHLVGPVARIGWGQPILIELKLGVVIELGANPRLLILGGVAVNLPTKDAALVSLNLSFFGVIDFGAGTISFDATLQNSRVLSWSISGDAAFRTGWAPRLNHIASVGGLHPSYPRPANFPDLRRISVNFGSNNPKVTLCGYAALTLNSVQFGARASLYAKGPDLWIVGQVAAEGEVYFDALIYFNPFGFDVQLGGSLTLLRNGKRAAGLGFKLRLRGPNTYQINGKVWITVCGIDVDFGINHSWGQRQSLPTLTANAVEVLRAALLRDARYEPVSVHRRAPGASFAQKDSTRQAIDPLGGVRFVQRAIPLDVALAKIGDAQVAGPKRIQLKVFQGTEELATTPAREDFVRGHFFNLTDAERLRAPDFDELPAGFELASDRLDFDGAKAITETYDYEIILIGLEDDRTRPAVKGAGVSLATAFADRWSRVTLDRVAVPKGSSLRALGTAAAVRVEATRYVANGTAAAGTSVMISPAARAAAMAGAEASFTRVKRVAAAPHALSVEVRETNVGVASYVLAAAAGGKK